MKAYLIILYCLLFPILISAQYNFQFDAMRKSIFEPCKEVYSFDFKSVKKKAKKNNASDKEYFLVGEAYWKGIHTKIDYEKALEYFSKCELDACRHRYAYMLINGEGTTAIPALGIQELQRLSNRDYNYAQLELGKLYYYGDTTDKDYIKAKIELDAIVDLQVIDSDIPRQLHDRAHVLLARIWNDPHSVDSGLDIDFLTSYHHYSFSGSLGQKEFEAFIQKNSNFDHLLDMNKLNDPYIRGIDVSIDYTDADQVDHLIKSMQTIKNSFSESQFTSLINDLIDYHLRQFKKKLWNNPELVLVAAQAFKHYEWLSPFKDHWIPTYESVLLNTTELNSYVDLKEYLNGCTTRQAFYSDHIQNLLQEKLLAPLLKRLTNPSCVLLLNEHCALKDIWYKPWEINGYDQTFRKALVQYSKDKIDNSSYERSIDGYAQAIVDQNDDIIRLFHNLDIDLSTLLKKDITLDGYSVRTKGKYISIITCIIDDSSLRKTLLDACSNLIQKKDLNGLTLFDYAIGYNSKEVLSYLLKKHKEDKYYASSLIRNVKTLKTKTLSFLTKHLNDVPYHELALKSIKSNRYELYHYCLEHANNKDIKWDELVLEMLKEDQYHPYFLRLLFVYHPKAENIVINGRPLFQYTSFVNHSKAVRQLISYKVDIYKTLELYPNGVSQIIANGELDILKALVETYSLRNLYFGRQELIYAIKTKDLNIVKYLIIKGTSVNYDTYARSPLKVSEIYGSSVISNFLRSQGAKYSQYDRDIQAQKHANEIAEAKERKAEAERKEAEYRKQQVQSYQYSLNVQREKHNCSHCRGSKRCTHCGGDGDKKCTTWLGGACTDRSCYSCGGTGTKQCGGCSGLGYCIYCH